MNPKNDRTQSDESRPAQLPAPPKGRFRLLKLEQRMAPKKNKPTHSNWGGGTIVY